MPYFSSSRTYTLPNVHLRRVVTTRTSSFCAVISCLPVLPFTILPLAERGTNQLLHIYSTLRRPMWNLLDIKSNKSYTERMPLFSRTESVRLSLSCHYLRLHCRETDSVQGLWSPHGILAHGKVLNLITSSKYSLYFWTKVNNKKLRIKSTDSSEENTNASNSFLMLCSSEVLFHASDLTKCTKAHWMHEHLRRVSENQYLKGRFQIQKYRSA